MNAVTFSGMHQDYTYDADGNVITRALPVDNATWVYTWSSDNRLLSGSNWTGMENLAYDALGQPVVIRKGSDNHITRVTLYDGGNVLADLDSLGNREGEYVYDAGTDHPYALLTGATAVTGVQYFVLDDFGNVTGTVYDSTHVAQTISYDDWGDATVTGDQTNRLAWKGLPIDSHLWLSEVRARWYDPVLGRFISEDPLGLSAGINPYIFANNDPINGHDPSGALATDQDGSVCSINASECGNALEFPGSSSYSGSAYGGGVSFAGGFGSTVLGTGAVGANYHAATGSGSAGDIRGLSQAERSTFSDWCTVAICDNVTIVDGPFSRSITFGYVIVLGTGDWNSPDVLAHELTHTTQYESWGAFNYYASALHDRIQDQLGTDPYAYTLDGRPYGSYGMEQQAQITQDCFNATNPRACSVTPYHKRP